jgi:hypothetical protein
MTIGRSRCKYCEVSLLWAVTPDESRLPLDAKPVPGGMYLLQGIEPQEAVYVKLDDRPKHGDLYIPHFQTCARRPR